MWITVEKATQKSLTIFLSRNSNRYDLTELKYHEPDSSSASTLTLTDIPHPHVSITLKLIPLSRLMGLMILLVWSVQ